MEMTLEIKQLPGEEKFFEEKVEEEVELSREEKVIPVLEETEMQEDTTTERLQNQNEVEVDNLQALGEGKVEATHIDSPKKSKQISKQIHKTKVTVPKPFSLETEKRILSRERRGSMDFKDSKLTHSKSSSLNHKNLSQSYLGPERSSDLRGSSTTKTGLKPKVVTDEKVDKIVVNGSSRKEKVNVKEAEKKKPQVAVKLQKQEESELRNNKLQKSSTFKALPLPSFYHQKDPPPKLETKKMRVTHSKPPLASETGKTMPKSDNKIEEKGSKVSRKIGTSAKETIGKLFRTTRNSLGTPKEKVMKAVVSSA